MKQTIPRTNWIDYGGINLPENSTIADALEIADLNFTVDKRPVYSVQNGEYVKIANQAEIYRTDTEQGFAIATDMYEPIQNDAVFGLYEEHLGKIGAKVVQAGSYKNGAESFMVLDLGEYEILKDDVIKKHLFTYTTHDTTGRLAGVYIAGRLGCLNQIVLGDTSLSITHKTNANQLIKPALIEKQLFLAEERHEQIRNEFLAMQRKEIDTKDRLKTLIRLLTPNDSEAQQVLTDYNSRSWVDEEGKKKPRIISDIESILIRHNMNTDIMKGMEGTVYGLVQSATGYYDHEKQGRNTKGNREAEIRSKIFSAKATMKELIVKRGSEVIYS